MCVCVCVPEVTERSKFDFGQSKVPECSVYFSMIGDDIIHIASFRGVELLSKLSFGYLILLTINWKL